MGAGATSAWRSSSYCRGKEQKLSSVDDLPLEMEEGQEEDLHMDESAPDDAASLAGFLDTDGEDDLAMEAPTASSAGAVEELLAIRNEFDHDMGTGRR